MGFQAEAISGYKSQIAELEKKIDVQETVQKGHPELTSLENTRDQASQDQDLLPAATAYQSRVEELEGLLIAHAVAHKHLLSTELDNSRHQLAKIKRLGGAIACRDVDLSQKHLDDVKILEAERKAGQVAQAARLAAEKKRDELVKAVGEMQGKLSMAMEGEPMEAVEWEIGVSRKRQNDGDEELRPA